MAERGVHIVARSREHDVAESAFTPAVWCSRYSPGIHRHCALAMRCLG